MTTYVLTRGAMDTIKYYVSHTSGFTITPSIVRGGGAGTATWNWGDGSATETGDSMSHVYAAGAYTVTLTLVDYPTYLTSIDVQYDHVVGDFLWALRGARALTGLYAHNNSGLNSNCALVNLSGWWPSLDYFYINSTSVSGDISGWVLPASLVNFYIYLTGVSGDISGWVLPASLARFYIYSTGVSGTPIFTSAVALADFRYQDCALPRATCNAILAAIWARRMSFTDAAPAGNIGGTNATPGGVYQNANPPTTGLEFKHVLVNDGNAEGFNKWAWTTS